VSGYLEQEGGALVCGTTGCCNLSL